MVATRGTTAAAAIREAALPLSGADADYDALLDLIGDARFVLLGEASHGTHEFYRERAEITRRLITEKGFTAVAVEADWPDAYRVNRYVRGVGEDEDADRALGGFRRFPTWMWRNTDVLDFVEWLRGHNLAAGAGQQAGFYGLDLYNLSSSMRAVIDFLEREDPEAAKLARRRYGCLEPWADNPARYGALALSEGYARCEAGVLQMMRDLSQRNFDCLGAECDEWLDAAANARLVKNAEAYYRVMYYGSAESWNLRDTHMFETLCQLLYAKGPESKAIVWAHNSHIGNAAHTEMGQVREELNIGQLCKERWGERARLIGFGTHAGTVACATDWDDPMEVKNVRPARPDSHERVFRDTGLGCFLTDWRQNAQEDLKAVLSRPRLERAIGVIYRPETELYSHYFEAVMAEQFDAFVWFDETRAVTPLTRARGHGMPETYPFGL